MSNLTGNTVQGYEVHEMIGSGGYGAIYRALEKSVNREVAIKVILPQHAENPEFRRRFETEATVVGQLEHPHIVPLYHYWHDDSGMYIVMRWLRGGSVKQSIEKDGGWPMRRALTLLEQVGGALSEAHQAGVVHRDIKPSNIMLDRRGNSYLADFGIAKRINEPSNITDPRAVLGSPAYLSPEQILGEEISPQTDIYGMGMTLYEILTGEHPFARIDTMRMVVKQLQDPVPELRRKRPDLPKSINEVIQKATSKAAAERFNSMAELLQAFKDAADR